jgi:hypothetical protein
MSNLVQEAQAHESLMSQAEHHMDTQQKPSKVHLQDKQEELV